MYISYVCEKCGTEMIIPTYQLKLMEGKGRYLACPFGHKKIKIINRYDSLQDCMKHDSHVKENGKVKQRGWGSG